MQHIRQYQPSDRHASLIVPRLSTLVASPCVISSAFRRPDMSGRLTGRSPAAICALTAAHPAVNNIVSSHPDAQRRRQESEDRTRERDLQLQRERGGMKWWQEASVIQSVDRPEDLKQRLASPGLVIVNFFSEECYSCKTLHPKLIRIAETNQHEVTFLKVNGSEPAFQPLFLEAGITAVPWFHMFCDGELVASMSASLSPERLQRLRDQIAELRAMNRQATA